MTFFETYSNYSSIRDTTMVLNKISASHFLIFITPLKKYDHTPLVGPHFDDPFDGGPIKTWAKRARTRVQTLALVWLETVMRSQRLSSNLNLFKFFLRVVESFLSFGES